MLINDYNQDCIYYPPIDPDNPPPPPPPGYCDDLAQDIADNMAFEWDLYNAYQDAYGAAAGAGCYGING